MSRTHCARSRSASRDSLYAVRASSLKPPPPLGDNTVRLIPLGGLGDIGRNMTVLEYRGELLLIDCGVLFPEDDHPGVDLILPGLDAIIGRLADVVALVLTHGHEDHIGAVPYLLRQRADIPLVGSKLTLALVEEKIREHRIRGTDHREVTDSQRLTLGGFDLEFLAVNHSIPDALALMIRTPSGTILHTGDFKLDQLPLDKRITDLRALARLGEEGVDLLMIDSTNAEVPGFITPEREIAPALDRVFARSRQRIIVACFASHVHRVQQVMDAAVAHGRKVVYVGRSMVRNMGVARELGYLHVPADTLIDLRDVDDYRPEDVVIISTGSQGEPLSALSRIADRDHPVISLKAGDTVVLASSLIPGNESSVYRVINGLSKLGAHVVHRGNALVHVSGHASAGELLFSYDLVRLVGKVDSGYIFVDGTTVGDISEASLTDRRILGEEGFISVVTVVNTHDSKIISGPDIHARGFLEDDSVFDPVRPMITAALEEALADGVDDAYRLQQVIRRRLGRWVSDTHRRRPMIIPVIIQT